jgi:hypothetical protein
MSDHDLPSISMQAWQRPAARRWMSANPRIQRTTLVSAVVASSVVVLTLVAVSPLALQLLGSFRGRLGCGWPKKKAEGRSFVVYALCPADAEAGVLRLYGTDPSSNTGDG